MKKIIIIFFFLASITACKKDYHFSKDDITVRDSNGNLSGNFNPEDWQLKPLSEADEFTQMVFNKLPENFNDNLINYNMDCIDTFQFDLKAYPNPMNSSHELNFTLNTNLEFVKGYIIIVDKKGKFLVGSALTHVFPNDEYVNPLINRDFIYYYILITADNCGYYGKGNVIGSKK